MLMSGGGGLCVFACIYSKVGRCVRVLCVCVKMCCLLAIVCL